MGRMGICPKTFHSMLHVSRSSKCWGESFTKILVRFKPFCRLLQASEIHVHTRHYLYIYIYIYFFLIFVFSFPRTGTRLSSQKMLCFPASVVRARDISNMFSVTTSPFVRKTVRITLCYTLQTFSNGWVS